MAKRLCIFAALLLAVASAWAIPVSYQGKITNTTGVALNGTYDVRIGVFDDAVGATLIDEQTADDVNVLKGLFSAVFDFDIPAAAGEMFLEISISDDDGATWTTFAPRQRVTATFSAIHATYADTAAFALVDLQGAYDNGNDIIIGTAGPLNIATSHIDGGIDIRAGSPAEDAIDARLQTDNLLIPKGVIYTEFIPNSGIIGASHTTGIVAGGFNDGANKLSGISGALMNGADPIVYGALGAQKNDGTNAEWNAAVYGAAVPGAGNFAGIFEGDVFVSGGIFDGASFGNDNQVLVADGVGHFAWEDAPESVNPDDFVQNQNAAAQNANFWIDGTGVIGGVTSFVPVEFKVFGTGTATTYSPADAYWHYTRSRTLIRADEIAAGGDPCTIDTLSIYLQTPVATTPWTYDTLIIWLELTTDTIAGTTWSTATATEVFRSNAFAVPQVAGWVHFNITDFAYDGTSNVRIHVQNGYQFSNYNSTRPAWAYTTQPNTARHAGGTSDSALPTSLTASSSRPNYRFGFSGLDVPAIVDRVTIENGFVDADNDVLINGVSLKNNTGAGVIGYNNATSGLTATNVQAAIDALTARAITSVDTINAARHDTVVVSEALKVMGELIADSIQAVGAQVIIDDNLQVDGCGYFSNYAGEPPVTLITEGFESATFPPTGWTAAIVTGATNWVRYITSPHSGAACARLYSTTRGEIAELITPSLNLSGAVSATLTFWHKMAAWGSDQDTLKVYYKTSAGGSWTLLATYNITTVDWTQRTLALPSPSGDYYIRFLGNAQYGYGIHIDDVTVVKSMGGSLQNTEICGGTVTTSVDIEAGGDINAAGDVHADANVTAGVNVAAVGDVSATSMTLNGVTITTWPAAGGSMNSLGDAYNFGGPGAGRTIIANNGPVVVNAAVADGDTAIVAMGNSAMPTAVFTNAGVGTAIEARNTLGGTALDVYGQALLHNNAIVMGKLSVDTIFNPSGDTVRIDDKLAAKELVTDTIEPTIAGPHFVFVNGGVAVRDSIRLGGVWRNSWPTGDNWGTQVAATNATLTGNGTATTPLGLAQQGATNGQVLTWNGTAWAPANVPAGGADDWGTQVAITAARLTGDGTATTPLDLAQNGATVGQVLKWDGTNWTPAADAGGDNWGTQVAATNATLTGNGTATTPLGLAQNGATVGQVLKWDGTNWTPAADAGGSSSSLQAAYALGNEIYISASTPVKVTDTVTTGTAVAALEIRGNDATKEALYAGNSSSTTGAATAIYSSGSLRLHGGASTRIYSTADVNVQLDRDGSASTTNYFRIRDDADAIVFEVTELGAAKTRTVEAQDSIRLGGVWRNSWPSGGDNWGTQVAVTNATLTGNGTATTPLGLAQNGATNGQVLKWNSTTTTWEPADDNIGAGGGETDPVFGASPAAGIVAGDIDNWDEAYSWGDHATAGYLTTTSLQDAYDGGTDILTDGVNPVSITTTTGTALYVNSGDANGIVNDANYSSLAGNITLGTGSYRSTGDFTAKIDSDNDGSNAFVVLNSTDDEVFTVDENGNGHLTGDLQVEGIIDPMGLALVPQAVAPTLPTPGIWVDATDNSLKYWDGTATLELGGGDDWGTQVVSTTARLTGDGTATTPIDLAQQGATNGQVLKWNGATWAPATDDGGDPDDFVQNQNAAAQDANFWIDGAGIIGGVTTTVPVDFKVFGTGTATTYSPADAYWHYTRSRTLIRADEIAAAGDPCTIDTLSIYLQTPVATTPWTYDTLIIWLELTTDTTAGTAWSTATATEVFRSNAFAVPQVAGWVHFNITDFPYDGTSNVRIHVQNGYQFSNYDATRPAWAYTTQPNTARHSGGTSDSAWPTSLTSSSSRPNYRFGFSGLDIPVIVDRVTIENGFVDADNDLLINGVSLKNNTGAGVIGYNNATSGLTAANVQAAVDEIETRIDNLGTTANYVHNQYTAAAAESFWVAGKGKVESNFTVGRPAVSGFYTAGTGSATSTYPFHYNYNYTISQALYTSTELGGTSFTAATLGWNHVTGSTAYTIDTVWIYVRDTTLTTLAGYTDPTAGDAGVLVYQGPINVPAAFGWFDVALTTPFAHAAGKNILVTIRKHEAYESSSREFAQTTMSNMHYSAANDASWPTPAVRTSRPNLRFGYSTLPSGGDLAVVNNATVGGNLTVSGGLNDGTTTGTAGQVLTADGTGNFSWQTPSGGGSSVFDSLWAKTKASTADTVRVLDNLFINGEAIVDSIQAVGAVVEVDDSIWVHGNAKIDNGVSILGGGLAVGNTYRTDWEPQNIITVGLSNADFVDLTAAVLAAGTTRPTAIRIAPGTFAYAGAPIPANVRLYGSGSDATFITGAITISNGAQAHHMSFNDAVTGLGFFANCVFTGGGIFGDASAAVVRECAFSGGSFTFNQLGIMEATTFAVTPIINCTGWKFDECYFTLGANVTSGTGSFNSCDFMGLSLNVNGAGAIANVTASSFHDVATAIVVTLGSLNLASSQFANIATLAVSATNANYIALTGNVFPQCPSAITFLNCNAGDFNIKDNIIIQCTGTGITLTNCQNVFVDNNIIKYCGVGVAVQGTINAQILRNSFFMNTTDLTVSAPGTIASWNTLNTYTPAGLGIITGNFNTQVNGTIWGTTGNLP